MAHNMRPSRSHTPDLQPRPTASSSQARLSLPVQKTSSGVQSSATWTSTSGDLGGLSDTDELGDRHEFVEEYNRIAKKHGIRPLVPDHPDNFASSGMLQKRGWWSRTFRRTSSQSTENSLRRRRSTSHVMGHLAHPSRDSLKDQDLQGLVRLCGKSFLYLPPEYTPGSLLLPTCFRATAQYLVQHAPGARGVFRIPGSVRVVNELYEFYCVGQSGDVSSTVRSPNLPAHIHAGIHDVASCFKKFLSGLPGGILGSLSLFDSMIAINSQLYGDPEFSRTKQSKIRARLIALAVSTLRSQYRRELICAVFGLLCLLGRAAETAPREDESGRPLPTSDLMGYNALGIVFGPLLVGDMLGQHTVKLSDPTTGLYLAPNSPSSSKSQKGKKKAKELVEDFIPPPYLDVDKIHVANNITEMLVTNWRDVARQMRNLDAGLGILRRSRSRSATSKNRSRRSNSVGLSSENEPLLARRPERDVENRPRSFAHFSDEEPRFDEARTAGESRSHGRYPEDKSRTSSRYPEDKPRNSGYDSEDKPRPFRRRPEDDSKSRGRRAEDYHAGGGANMNRAVSFRQIDSANDALSVRKTRPTSDRDVSNMRPPSGQLGALSPPREESADEDRDVHPALRNSSPLKSSLKSSASKLRPDLHLSKGASEDEDALSTDNIITPPPPPRSPDRLSSGISPVKKQFEPLQSQAPYPISSSTYSTETRWPKNHQIKPRGTPTPTGPYNLDYDYPRERDTSSQAPKAREEKNYSRQRASPTRSENNSPEYDQPRSRASPNRSETYSPEYSQTETPRVGYSHSQRRVPRAPAERLATTHKPGYDVPRPRTSPTLGDPSRPRTEYGIEYSPNESSHRCTSASSSKNDQRSTAPMALNQVDGSPDSTPPQLATGLDPMIAFQPGMKILRAPSTMRSQPRSSHVDSDVTPAKLRSSVWRSSSRGSRDSVAMAHYEPIKASDSGSKPEKVAPDQMDGAADIFITVPSSRSSVRDLRGEFEKRRVRDGQASSLPVSKSRIQPRAAVTKKNGQGKKPSWATPHKSSPKSTFTGRRGVRPCASRVMGLAAMFDTAAKASPYLPTPGGAVQQKRRETAGVVSPYTSNPSPHAPAQSMTSVSTPVSLLSPRRLSIHLSTAGSSGKKSLIPRLQNQSTTPSTGKMERRVTPVSVIPRHDESRVSITISHKPSRFFTPSRLPVKKKVSPHEPPSLPQFDGLSSTKQSVLQLNAQQEIPPVGYYSCPIPQTKAIGDRRGIPQLSQHSTSSRYSEERGHSRESSSLGPALSRVRSASSLRDLIRSLRSELSSKNEDCAQLRFELEESRKMREVNEILLREDVDRAREETQKWRRRAEKAEKKVDKYEALAMQIKEARDRGLGRSGYRRGQQGNTADDYSFMSGSDQLTSSDRAASQPLTARMNQSVRRTPPVGANGANSMGTCDGFSECSSSTVVRTHVGPNENGPASGGGLWSAVDELVVFASPGLLDEPL